LARQAAERFHHDYIGTEHMLLGIVEEGSGVAAQVLRNLDVEPRKVQDELEKILQNESTPAPTGQLPFTPRGKRVLDLSLEEARALGDGFVGTEHLLLGLIAENEGIAARVLRGFGLNLERVRGAVVELLAQVPKAAPSPGASAARTPLPNTPRRPELAGKAIPILPMRDARATTAFYERLGFRLQFDASAAGKYAFARRGDVEIHFFAHPEVDPKSNDAGCYVRVEDADALHAEFLAAAIEGLAAIGDKPWGMREFHIIDPSGNLLRIGHRRRG
jgi:catechol 2,3-dioxygenase-like lactoylglutathione lyase family enzyme